jgi:prepilin-type N-terminal cleavage/methylation domain-containing protein
MNGYNRRGFTLVEFVLALGLIVIVAGLIVPAVSKVREAADRMRCLNNLKQVVLATHNVHDTMGFVPSNPDTINERHGTTLDFLQPYLE